MRQSLLPRENKKPSRKMLGGLKLEDNALMRAKVEVARGLRCPKAWFVVNLPVNEQ